MLEGFGMGIAYAMNVNQREFDKLAHDLRTRIAYTKECGDIEHPLQIGMLDTMNGLTDEIREIEEGKRSPEQARLSSTTTSEHRVRKFQEMANASCRRLSEGKFELEFKKRDQIDKVYPTSMHGSDGDTKLRRI